MYVDDENLFDRRLNTIKEHKLLEQLVRILDSVNVLAIWETLDSQEGLCSMPSVSK